MKHAFTMTTCYAICMAAWWRTTILHAEGTGREKEHERQTGKMGKKLQEKYGDLIESDQPQGDTIQIKAPVGCENVFISLTRDDYTPAIMKLEKIKSIQTIEEIQNKSRIQRRNAKPGKTLILYGEKEILVQESCRDILKKLDNAIMARRQEKEQDNGNDV